jgi:hypothetical protein
LKTIKSSYYWGNYREEVLSAVTNTTAGPSPWKTIVLPPQNGFTAIDQYYAENVTIKSAQSSDNGSDYGVNNNTAYRTSNIFDDMFPSFLTVAKGSTEPKFRGKFTQKGPMWRVTQLYPWLPQNNVSHHLERLAVAMTDSIRSSASSENVIGMAFGREMFVKVNWEWLTLPLFILVLTIIFLIATIVKTRKEREQTGIFKNSAFATLLSSMPPEMQRRLTEDSATGKAREMKVKYVPDKGWRVSGFSFSPKPPQGAI